MALGQVADFSATPMYAHSPVVQPGLAGSLQAASPCSVDGVGSQQSYATGYATGTYPLNYQSTSAQWPLQDVQAGPAITPAASFPIRDAPQNIVHAPQQTPAPQQQVETPAPDTTNEPWLTMEAQLVRRTELRIDSHADFIESCEFVSLGNFCGVARALQALGVKKHAYPFDWVRSPAFGVIHCLETEFEDFLTYTVARNEGPKGHLFGNTHWGGSFWHHDIVSPNMKDDFVRRIERFYGCGEVPAERARVFVRALNSTSELNDCARLHQALKHALPDAKAVYLLILIDMQTDLAPFRISGYDETMLFCKLHEGLFADNGAQWSMEKQGVAYAEAIAFAIRAWDGDSSAKAEIREMPDVHSAMRSCHSFEGGSCASELFFPRRFQGQSLKIHRSAEVAPSSSTPAPDTRQQHTGKRVSQRVTRGLKKSKQLYKDGVVELAHLLRGRPNKAQQDDSEGSCLAEAQLGEETGEAQREMYFSEAQESARQRGCSAEPGEQARSHSRSQSRERNSPSQSCVMDQSRTCHGGEMYFADAQQFARQRRDLP